MNRNYLDSWKKWHWSVGHDRPRLGGPVGGPDRALTSVAVTTQRDTLPRSSFTYITGPLSNQVPGTFPARLLPLHSPLDLPFSCLKVAFPPDGGLILIRAEYFSKRGTGLFCLTYYNLKLLYAMNWYYYGSIELEQQYRTRTL